LFEKRKLEIMNMNKWLATLGVAGTLVGLSVGTQASSHSDAPLIKLDPQANLTDVYAFRRNKANGTQVLVVEISVRPFCEPGDGIMYDAFSDDARYSIHIANPNTGAELQRYDFKFSPVSGARGNYKNLDTILRYGRGTTVGPIETVGDSNQNFVQTYTITKVVGGVSTVLNGTQTLMCPPANTGKNTTPHYNGADGFAVSGASTRGSLDAYTQQTTYDLAGGYTSFAGSREDGFYADTPGIFDLLDSRILLPSPKGTFGQTGNGVDGFKGYNVLHYAIEIPLTQLPTAISYQAPFSGSAPGIAGRSGLGVYASVARPRVTLRSTTSENISSGPYVQVNREANPLFNEVLVAIRDKDNYNRDSPTSDATKYAKYAQNPEVAVLINAVYGTSFATTARADLAAVYIPDVIRVDTSTGPARVAGETGFSRLGFLGGDVLTNTNGVTVPGGWPNGRRLGDDVIDIALTAVASGPTYTTVTVVGDNIDHNDQVYNMTFPYAGTPNAGTRNRKDSEPAH